MSLVDKLFRLDGSLAVINGGAGRIGSKIAEAFVVAGATTVILDLSEEAGNKAVSWINEQSESERAFFAQVDSTDRAALDRVCERVVDQHGPVATLVNAIQFRGSGFYGSNPAEHSLEAWDNVLQVNLTGVFLACQAFYEAMKAAGGGTIINLASTYGVVSADPRIYGDSGVNSPISYGTSKAAILNLTRYLAVHWRGDGIRVNCLVPGGVFDNQDDDFVDAYNEI
ncbi:MAG: SDR family NAD(P)-dependent oxidoreductase, partial [Planctomycetota bacterium]